MPPLIKCHIIALISTQGLSTVMFYLQVMLWSQPCEVSASLVKGIGDGRGKGRLVGISAIIFIFYNLFRT